MTELFGARDKSGQLRVFTSDNVIKNNGRGYWIPKYNSGTREFVIDDKQFPEIEWEDDKPTPLVLINPAKKEDRNVEEVSIAGTIRVSTPSHDAPYNIAKGSKITMFVNDISYFEPCEQQDYSSAIHMKSGETILCEETNDEIRRLIKEAEPC